MGKEPFILKETSRGIQSVAIEDELLGKRQMFITDEINAQTSNYLIKQLMFLEQEDSGKEITVYINSPGGEVVSGLAVYDYMNLMTSPIRTVCIGTAASMGAILFLAGEKREMLPHTKVMIHDPSFQCGFAGAKPLEIQKQVDSLMETRKILCEIISERTGKPVKEVYKKTKYDSFFSAKEAVGFGLATGIISKL
jgi:Protease subunit of ATP-dependent Clp proteases